MIIRLTCNKFLLQKFMSVSPYFDEGLLTCDGVVVWWSSSNLLSNFRHRLVSALTCCATEKAGTLHCEFIALVKQWGKTKFFEFGGILTSSKTKTARKRRPTRKWTPTGNRRPTRKWTPTGNWRPSPDEAPPKEQDLKVILQINLLVQNIAT